MLIPAVTGFMMKVIISDRLTNFLSYKLHVQLIQTHHKSHKSLLDFISCNQAKSSSFSLCVNSQICCTQYTHCYKSRLHAHY